MKVAIVGSRGIRIQNLGNYLPRNTTEIISGGAKGVDSCAKEFAQQNGILLTEFLPEYSKFGRAAPIKRNITIVEYADCVFAFWDGKSKGTQFVIDFCNKINKQIYVYLLKD